MAAKKAEPLTGRVQADCGCIGDVHAIYGPPASIVRVVVREACPGGPKHGTAMGAVGMSCGCAHGVIEGFLPGAVKPYVEKKEPIPA